ncbi:2-keto-4-pentenoate hydratase [Benzoatithermus flavus]|uniref:Fumarylacetoacetate hydrolase family protein n=1 Tax=Benzoatithermus flavus TaxID=3108223 RepID=A0ABU8XKE3_9PROT
MQTEALTAAAETVVAARLGRRRLGRLQALERLEDGYAVQAAANARLEAVLGPRVGHKIGGTTAAMRRYLNVPEPMAGEIFTAQAHPDGASVRRDDHVRLGIETEIAVRLGRDLPPRSEPYRRADVAEAVAAVMAAIELVDDRYEDFATIGAATLIADNAFDAGSILGAPVADWRGLDLGRLVARTIRDGVVIAEGTSDALYGHPLDALAWLAERRRMLGLGLAAGSFVSLGSITPVAWVEGPARYRIEVERLGAVEVVTT